MADDPDDHLDLPPDAPFAEFDEWASEADRQAYADL